MQNPEGTKKPIEESTEHVTTQSLTKEPAAQETTAAGKPSVAPKGTSDADASETPVDTPAEATPKPKPKKAVRKDDADSVASKQVDEDATIDKPNGSSKNKSDVASLVRVRPSSRSMVKTSGKANGKAITKASKKPAGKLATRPASKGKAKAAPAKKRRPAPAQTADPQNQTTPKPASKKPKKQQAKPLVNPFARHESAQTGKSPAQSQNGKKHVAKHIAPPKPPQPDQIATKLRSFFQNYRQWPQLAKENLQRAWEFAKANPKSPKVIVPAVVLVLYVVGSIFFMSHYLPGTTINKDSVTLKTANAAVDIAKHKLNNYAIKVSGDGLDLTVNSSDINLSLNEDVYRDDAAKCLPGWVWPFKLFTNRDYAVVGGISYDKDKVDAKVSSAAEEYNENATPPKDANITYDTSKNSFVPVEEKGGTAIDTNAATAIVDQSISMLLDSVELDNDELQQPQLRSNAPEMNDAIRKANSLIELKFPLLVQNKTVETVDKELLKSWITLDGSYDPQGDLDTITAWAKEDLSAEVDTVGTMRTFTRPNDGKRIEVYGGGTYGWNMDGAELSKLICKQLQEKSEEPIQVPMQSEGEVFTHGGQDWGPRFVDVDLSEQYVRMFDEDSNIIMESECVSGNMAEGNDTVTGVFYLEDKQSPALLVGLDNDGDGLPDYENEVQFWMPFCGGYGLHDALWRDYFGGNAFQYDGSHGCVNLPYYAADILYGLIKVGDTVVVHW